MCVPPGKPSDWSKAHGLYYADELLFSLGFRILARAYSTSYPSCMG